jgi:DNA-binding transcriptional MocR family regulator
LGLLRDRGVPWRELGDQYGVSLNAVAQHYARLEARVSGNGPTDASRGR